MNYILTIGFALLFGYAISQECFQSTIPINNIQKWERSIEYSVLEENDSIVKICWWPSYSFRNEVYNGRKVVETQIIKALPRKEDLKNYEFRGYSLNSEISIEKRKVEFYTLCY